MRTKIISIFLIIVLLQASICSVMAANTSALEKEKDKVNEALNDAKDKKDEIDEQLDAQLSEIAEFDKKITQSENEIKNIESQLEDLENSITEKGKQIEKKQVEYKQSKELLETRLAVMYESGEMSFLDILFKSANLVEFLSNYYNLSQIVESDKELLASIEKERISIEEAKAELEAEKVKVEELKQEKVAKANALKAQKAERQKKADALSANQKELQSQIDSHNAKLKEIDNAIAQAMKDAMQAEQNGGAGSNFDGTFTWPLDYSPRRVTSRMKWRWGRWHKGIDIGTNAEIGKRVVSAASGTVIYSAYQSGSSSAAGYGNYLIIYHGNGFATLYAHMDSKIVSTGQRVSKGQLIGYSGNTGGVAPHLHFEIRKATSVSNFFGNNWLDPLDYMPGGYVIVD